MCKINLHSSESTTKDQLPLVVKCWTFLAHLMWFCRFCYEPLDFFLATRLNMSPHVCSHHLTVVYDKMCITFINVIQLKDNSEVVCKRPNLDSIFRHLPSGADVSVSVFFHSCLIVFTLPKLFARIFFSIAAELRCNYMILNPITFEPYNLTFIPITNFSTGNHNYNAQT